MEDQRRHVEPLQVLGLVGLGERLDAEVGCREARHHALQPERFADTFRDLGARPVVAVERQAEVLPELRPVGLHAVAEPVEHLDRQSAGIGRRLHHQRRYRADQHRLGHAPGAMAADVARHLAAAGGMTDMDRIGQVERLGQRGQVVRVGVEVVAVPGLARAAMAAPIVRDAAVAALCQEEHLVLERVRRQRPPMAEDHRLPRPPVIVVDLGSILGRDRRHGMIPRAWLGWASLQFPLSLKRPQDWVTPLPKGRLALHNALVRLGSHVVLPVRMNSCRKRTVPLRLAARSVLNDRASAAERGQLA